jgi:hypothetical protein
MLILLMVEDAQKPLPGGLQTFVRAFEVVLHIETADLSGQRRSTAV